MRKILFGQLFALLAFATTIGFARGAVSAPPDVAIVSFTYVPATVTVQHGAKVTFVNLDAAAGVSHTASYPVGCLPGSCVWSTPLLKLAKPSAAVTINLAPGTYFYYCQVHPFMMARVKVT